MRIILIGNYRPDQLESMDRFAQMLYSGFTKRGIEVVIWRPTPVFGRLFKRTNYGVGKWLGYIDKFLIFPVVLAIRLRKANSQELKTRFHVCDQGNAPYLKFLPAHTTGITCHDVLAIRGALGFNDAYAPASATGKIFQKWIYYHLSRSTCLASVTENTLKQLIALKCRELNAPKSWRVVHNALNNNFGVISGSGRDRILKNAGINPKVPFVLHVGSNSVRKNRKLLIDMVDYLGDQWMGLICFAGEAPDESLLSHAESLGLKKRIIAVTKPDHQTLVSLYNACFAFIFPSFSEGFGWPLIEAQACGAPIIASSLEPLPEVCGDGALYADPYKFQEFAKAFLLLHDPDIRSQLIERGIKNSNRFKAAKMIDEYLDLHGIEQLILA